MLCFSLLPELLLLSPADWDSASAFLDHPTCRYVDLATPADARLRTSSVELPGACDGSVLHPRAVYCASVLSLSLTFVFLLQTSSRAQDPDRAYQGRRGHSPQISISDDNHHVTEAIGDMYGDHDFGSKQEPRPLSFTSTPPNESREKGSSYFESKRASPPKSPLERAVSNDRKYSPMNASPRPDSGRKSSVGAESASSSHTHLHRSTSETATQPFPLNDIDYESSPAAVAQELSNLQAIRRMSMDVNGADPDLPSFASNFGNVPTVPPSHSADEDDASRLFWVPARLHPELAPKEFKTFIEDKVDRIRRRSGGEDSLLSSDGIERQGSAGGLRRKKSMLSRQIDTPNGYEDGAERLERQGSGSGHTPSAHPTNLSEIEGLVSNASKLMGSLSINTNRKSNDSGVELATGDDKPILPPAPSGQTLRRSTRTTYRRGSLKKGERVPFSKRAAGAAGRSADTDTEDSPISSPTGGAREELDFSLNRVQTEPTPPRRSPEPPGNFSRPRKAKPVQAGEEAEQSPPIPHPRRVSLTEERPPQRISTEPPESERPRPIQPKPFHSRIASNGRTTAPLPGYTPPPNVPSIVETPPPQDVPHHPSQHPLWHPERKSSHAPPPSAPQHNVPRGLRKPPGAAGRPVMGSRPQSSPAKNANQTLEDMAGQPSPLPGHSVRTDSLSFIPTFEEQKPDPKKVKDKKDASDGSRKTSWSWGSLLGSEEKAREKEQKERDERELATKRIKASKPGRSEQKAIDNTRLDLLQTSIDGGSLVPTSRESLVLDRDTIRLEEERKKEASSRKAGAEGKKEKDSGLLASIFGGARKKSPSNDHGHSKKPSSLRGLSPDPPPARILKPDIDYNWTRFSILEERAIYRMAHMKLANPRRALYSQVLLSNFMYSYLAKVQQMHPQIQIAGQPGQGKVPGQMERGDGQMQGQAQEKVVSKEEEMW